MRGSRYFLSRTLVGAVVSAGLYAQNLVVAFAVTPSTPVQYRGTAVLDGEPYAGISYVRYQQSTYINETQAVHLLNGFGLGAVATGNTLSALWLGQFHASTGIRIDGTDLNRAGSFTIHGNEYANLSAIANFMHWRLTYTPDTGTLRAEPGVRLRQTVTQNHTALPVKATGSRTTPDASQTWGAFNGSSVPIVTISGTRYLSVWYFMHILNETGFHAVFQDGRLVIPDLPSVVQDGTLTAAGNSAVTTLIRYNGAWYGPLSAVIEGFGISASVNRAGTIIRMEKLPPRVSIKAPPAPSGSFTVWVQSAGGTAASNAASNATSTATAETDTAAFLLQDGTVRTAQVPDSSGGVEVTLPGSQAVFMGYQSPGQGWMGSGESVDATTSLVTLPVSSEEGTVKGRVRWNGRPGVVGSVVVRNVATHAQYRFRAGSNGTYAGQLPYGVYEIWSVDCDGQSLFIGSRFIVDKPLVQLATVTDITGPTDGLAVGPHCVVMAEDANISGYTLLNVVRTFEQVYSKDVRLLDATVRVPIIIQVFGSNTEFTQHFLDESYDTSLSGTYGQDTQAVTEGPQYIALNASGLTEDDEMNVLAHEYLHALLAATFTDIPTWLNEGLAWHAGIHAELGDSPSTLLSQSLWWNLWLSPVAAAKAGQLYPLLTASSVATRYNVEAQDSFAVEELLRKKGTQALVAFLKKIPRTGEAAAFQSVFQESETKFATHINAELTADAALSPKDLQVQVRTDAEASSEVFVSNPQGKTFLYTGAVPNTLYTFTFSVHGQVKAPPGLALAATSQSPTDNHWDIGAQVGQNQSFFSISNEFGLGTLITTNTFYGNSNVAEPLLTTTLPLHLELVSIKVQSPTP